MRTGKFPPSPLFHSIILCESSTTSRRFGIRGVKSRCQVATGQDEKTKKKAEKTLRELFRDKEDEARGIIFSWLSLISDPDEETLGALEAFRNDPANKGIIKEMQPQIARFKKSNKT